MKQGIHREDGYATLLVLMLAVALFLILATAMKNMYSAHNQNKQDKAKILRKAEQLNQTNAGK